MKLSAVLLLAIPVVGDAAGCPCKTGSSQQTQAPGNPTYPANAPAYGWGCKAHDSGSEQMFVVGWNGTLCDNDTTTLTGEANDWCEDKFCIVDPNNCDKRYLKLTYTGATDDWFSYEADNCNTAFKGNGWVGRCQNCPTHLPGTSGLTNSYCACNGGKPECPCVATPVDADPYPAQQEQNVAGGRPAYPGDNTTHPAYGWGCAAHDDGYDVCDGAAGRTSKAAGQGNDWCEDHFCIVDNNKCTGNSNIKLEYSNEPNDYFSYETCDVNFAGNGWVGRCTGIEPYPLNESYYSCPTPAPTTAPSAAPTAAPTADTSLASQMGLAAVGATLLAWALFQ